MKTFIEAVRALKPTGIIGVSTIAKAFDAEVLQTMAALNERPIVFALSNPTSKSECTFEEAVKETKGKVRGIIHSVCLFNVGFRLWGLTASIKWWAS